MLADFDITRFSNDMQIAVQKHHLRGEILYRTLDPPKKPPTIIDISQNGDTSMLHLKKITIEETKC